jgi:hypothetical protein
VTVSTVTRRWWPPPDPSNPVDSFPSRSLHRVVVVLGLDCEVVSPRPMNIGRTVTGWRVRFGVFPGAPDRIERDRTYFNCMAGL